MWFGERISQVELGDAGPRPERRFCAKCQFERQFRAVLWYRVLFVGGPFGAISERKYYFLCSICNDGWTLDKASVDVPLSKIPLPFMYRYGLVIGLCLLFVVVFVQAVF